MDQQLNYNNHGNEQQFFFLLLDFLNSWQLIFLRTTNFKSQLCIKIFITMLIGTPFVFLRNESIHCIKFDWLLICIFLCLLILSNSGDYVTLPVSKKKSKLFDNDSEEESDGEAISDIIEEPGDKSTFELRQERVNFFLCLFLKSLYYTHNCPIVFQ